MANPSINLPDDMVGDIDDRRHSTVSRSEWFRDAARVRMKLEDAGEWEDWLATANDEPAAVPDGGDSA